MEGMKDNGDDEVNETNVIPGNIGRKDYAYVCVNVHTSRPVTHAIDSLIVLHKQPPN